MTIYFQSSYDQDPLSQNVPASGRCLQRKALHAQIENRNTPKASVVTSRSYCRNHHCGPRYCAGLRAKSIHDTKHMHAQKPPLRYLSVVRETIFRRKTISSYKHPSTAPSSTSSLNRTDNNNNKNSLQLLPKHNTPWYGRRVRFEGMLVGRT